MQRVINHEAPTAAMSPDLHDLLNSRNPTDRADSRNCDPRATRNASGPKADVASRPWRAYLRPDRKGDAFRVV